MLRAMIVCLLMITFKEAELLDIMLLVFSTLLSSFGICQYLKHGPCKLLTTNKNFIIAMVTLGTISIKGVMNYLMAWCRKAWSQDHVWAGARPDFGLLRSLEAKNNLRLVQVLPVHFTAFTSTFY